MKIIVLSNRSQYEAFLKKGCSIDEFKIICDNPRFVAFLNENKLGHHLLNELDISEEKRKKINSWGCEKAANWIRISKEGGFFKEYDFASCVFLHFGYLLVQMLKNFYYANLIIEKYVPDHVVVFDIFNGPAYPRFSGNVYLNRLLCEICAQKGISTEHVKVAFEKDYLLRGFLNWKNILSASFKTSLRKFVNVCYGISNRPRKDVSILVRGPLKHIDNVVTEAHERGLRIALYDYEFQVQSYDFAKKSGIPYYIYDSFKRAKYDKRALADKMLKDIIGAVDHATSNELFMFDSHDFGKFIRENIFHNMGHYCGMVTEWIGQYKGIIQSCDVRAFILDEDNTLRNSSLATFMKTIRRKDGKSMYIFTVSHATMPVNFSVPKENAIYGLSTTFVNSEFEKLMYKARGWSEKGIAVTGTPRFDRLTKICGGMEDPRTSGGRIRILYCGASMKVYWPERAGYLGYQIKSQGDCQRSALRSIFAALKGLSAKLVIKPHNFEGRAWQDFLSVEKPGIPVRIESNTADFLKLLNECDAMILSHWSTALIEAALCDKPTILLDYYNSKDLAPYSEFGYCEVVRNDGDLKDAVVKLCKHLKGDKSFYIRNRDDRFESVFGRIDANNTARVVDYIEKTLKI